MKDVNYLNETYVFSDESGTIATGLLVDSIEIYAVCTSCGAEGKIELVIFKKFWTRERVSLFGILMMVSSPVFFVVAVYWNSYFMFFNIVAVTWLVAGLLMRGFARFIISGERVCSCCGWRKTVRG